MRFLPVMTHWTKSSKQIDRCAMFFIPPDGPRPVETLALPLVTNEPNLQHKRKYDEAFSFTNDVSCYYPKRNQRACDRCRLRKAKCTGGDFCEKCRRDGVVCTTNRNPKHDQKPPSAAYVQMVEAQRDFLIRTLEGLSRSEGPSKPDVEKIIRDFRMPSDAQLDEKELCHSSDFMASNNSGEELVLPSACNVNPGVSALNLSQETNELSNKTSEMDDWLTLLDDPWGPFANALETVPSLSPGQLVDIASCP